MQEGRCFPSTSRALAGLPALFTGKSKLTPPATQHRGPGSRKWLIGWDFSKGHLPAMSPRGKLVPRTGENKFFPSTSTKSITALGGLFMSLKAPRADAVVLIPREGATQVDTGHHTRFDRREVGDGSEPARGGEPRVRILASFPQLRNTLRHQHSLGHCPNNDLNVILSKTCS